MLTRWQEMLQEVIHIPGVRGALVVSADDGLVVAETVMPDVETADLAALAAALVARSARMTQRMGATPPRLMHLEAEQGALVAAAGPDPLWLVALTRPEVEFGRLRLLLGDLAGVLD